MPFYTRHPLDTLLLSDPFFTSFFHPGAHNTPRQATTSDAGSDVPTRAFSPNFDIHETPKEYVLEGELPGLDKNNLNIEFSDSNALIIRGKIEKKYTAGVPPGQRLEGTQMKGAITEGEKKEGDKKEEDEAKQDEEQVKYWVSERTVGSFQRSFNFPGEIDQDNVKANLENGILKIVVPKKEKRVARKIDIQWVDSKCLLRGG